MIRTIAIVLYLLATAPCSAQSTEQIIERYQRSLVVVRCPVAPWGELNDSIGLPVRDRSTILSTNSNARCRRNVVVELASGERIAVRDVRQDPETGLALYELATPLPFDPPPLVGSDGGKVSVYSFRFVEVGEAGAHGVFRRIERPATHHWRGSRGSPLLDEHGRLIGVLRGLGRDDEVVRTSHVLALLSDPPEPRGTQRLVSGGIQLGLPFFYEPRRTNAPELFGFGLELGAELSLDDTAFLASSSYFFALGPFGSDSAGSWRAQQDVRGGARFTLTDWAVLTLEGGIAVGFEHRPEWDIGADGNVLWARPLARASVRIFGAMLAYSCLVDVEHPASSTHQFTIGYSFDLP